MTQKFFAFFLICLKYRHIVVAEKMFCFQCEQTKSGKGCTTVGVCGKLPEVAELQDLLCGLVKGIAIFSTNGKKEGVLIPEEIYDFSFSALFRLTNILLTDLMFPLSNNFQLTIQWFWRGWWGGEGR